MRLYDVIIVGAGPAGLSCANSLKDLNVLLIEKKENPYKKIPCGEWVPLNFDAETIVETDGMITIYPDNEIVSKYKGKIINRNNWQKKLLESLNCEIHLSETVKYVEDNLVVTDKGEYKTEWIVGADGPDSIVKRYLGNKGMKYLPAINLKIRVKNKFKETIIKFDEYIKYGYAWCFPRGEVCNIGIGMIGDMRKPLFEWIEFLKKRGLIYSDVLSWAGKLIPISGFKNILRKKVILTGDAGGFVDPITGAGIIYAWDTGKFAADLISDEISYRDYEEKIRKIYERFFKRRLERRKILEENWKNLKEAVEKSWIAFILE